MLRHALGLSAWKRFKPSRWALRVNPSSGNLHPTEAYVICGALPGLADRPAVYHYAADRHALELRCVFDDGRWQRACRRTKGRPARRADVHSLARGVEVRRAGVPLLPARPRPRDGGRVHRRRRSSGGAPRCCPAWSHRAIAAVTGIDRDEDFVEAEREEPGCIMAMTAAAPLECAQDTVRTLVDAVRAASGRATRVS